MFVYNKYVNNNYKTLNIEGQGPKNKDEFIKFNKFCSNLKKSTHKSKKRKRCAICKKTDVKYCNSHTIPQFILKKISKNGKLLNTQALNSTKMVNDENGLNETQVFHSICRDCDNLIFKDYETLDNYNKEPTQKILKQIALKNHLYSAYKHNQEKILYNNLIKNKMQDVADISFTNSFQHLLKVTEHNYCYNQKRANIVIKNLLNNKDLYKLCYFKKLNYVVPLALQDNSIISFGFQGEKLASTFDFPSFDYADDIHFCIYPLENESIIMLFCAHDLNLYDNFFDTLKIQNENEQLSIINFLVFAYFEEVFISKNLDESILKNDNLKKISQEQLLVSANPYFASNLTNTEHKNYCWNALENNFSIENHSKIPNLLDAKYKIT